ncbi:MAG: NADH-quinone oxidoreductase subunit A [Candidatus Sulfotelmatobacter sp.]
MLLTCVVDNAQRAAPPPGFSLKWNGIGATMACWLDKKKPMPQNYVPIFIFIALVGVMLPVTLLAAKLVRPDNPSKTKLMPYECGIDPIDSARGRYTVRYYIIAILFVVFDVETIFLFPWAVKFKAFGLFGLIEMLIFLAILIVGYIWVWKKGALEWV